MLQSIYKHSSYTVRIQFVCRGTNDMSYITRHQSLIIITCVENMSKVLSDIFCHSDSKRIVSITIE